MDFVNSLKEAVNLIFNPSQAKKKKSIADVLEFYFIISIFPIIATTLFATLLTLRPFLIPVFLITSIVFYIILPFGIMISSGIYYLIIRKLFNLYDGNFKDTFTAFIYFNMPYILFSWLGMIPFIGNLFLIIILIWSFIMAILVISKMFNISKLKAFMTIILDVLIIAFAIVFLLLLILF